ncbi:MurR/RpiR family transcriptional regulator [Amycolatopsis echigonensis]|uniref:MurR/RpiR family transcriptional regulator n=1 Tax=Amycolatopsis echigonensis TaxID=2576905 RepID=A0A8E1W8U1_9PSEU|nr:MurR/RpiR family transcriptional regulator [Amycolatopsis echigonensis]MBB2505678.1 MurR/RpiR family transcriptional regulator [Amycolatopsis echigonensis]
MAAIAEILTPSEAQVAEWMAANPALVAVSSTAEVGAYTDTSDATVVRTTKKLGYQNFRELRRSALAVSGRHRDPSKVLDHQLGQISHSDSGPKTVLRDTAQLLAQFEADLDTESWTRAVSAISRAGRVVTYGIGPSGCPAEYLSITLKRAGLRTAQLSGTGFSLADSLLDLTDNDVVILFATLRRFREIDVVLDHVAKVGATAILVSETLGEALRERVHTVLATPPATATTSDGVLMGMAVARALYLAVAAENQADAVHSMERLNTLRAEIVGGKLDSEP